MSEGKAVLIRHLTLMTRGVRQRKSFYHTAAAVRRKQHCEIATHWRNECVIAMVAFRRILLGILWPLLFPVLCTEAVDCQWGTWGPWGSCSKSCEHGRQYRRRGMLRAATQRLALSPSTAIRFMTRLGPVQGLPTPMSWLTHIM